MKRKVTMIRCEESKHMHTIPYIFLRCSFTRHDNDIGSTSTAKCGFEREQIRTKKNVFICPSVSPKFLFSPHTVLFLSTPTTPTTYTHTHTHTFITPWSQAMLFPVSVQGHKLCDRTLLFPTWSMHPFPPIKVIEVPTERSRPPTSLSKNTSDAHHPHYCSFVGAKLFKTRCAQCHTTEAVSSFCFPCCLN